MHNELWNQFGPAGAWYIDSRTCAQTPLACPNIVKTSWLWCAGTWPSELTREQDGLTSPLRLFSGIRARIDEKQLTQLNYGTVSGLVWTGEGGGDDSHTHTHSKTRVSKTYKVQLTWEMTVGFASFRNLRKRTWQEEKRERVRKREGEEKERGWVIGKWETDAWGNSPTPSTQDKWMEKWWCLVIKWYTAGKLNAFIVLPIGKKKLLKKITVYP